MPIKRLNVLEALKMTVPYLQYCARYGTVIGENKSATDILAEIEILIKYIETDTEAGCSQEKS